MAAQKNYTTPQFFLNDAYTDQNIIHLENQAASADQKQVQSERASKQKAILATLADRE